MTFFCWFIWFLIGVIQHRPGLRLGRVEKKTLAGSNMGWAGILEFDPFSEGTFGFIFWAPPFVVWSRSISLWVKAVRSWPTKSSAARRRCSTACRPGTWWILGFGWVVGNGRCLKIWFRRTDLMWPKNKSFNTSEVKNPWRFSFFSLSSVFFSCFTSVHHRFWPTHLTIPSPNRTGAETVVGAGWRGQVLLQVGGSVAGSKGMGLLARLWYLACVRKIVAGWLNTSIYIFIILFSLNISKWTVHISIPEVFCYGDTY